MRDSERSAPEGATSSRPQFESLHRMTPKFADPHLASLNDEDGFADDGMRRALCEALEPGETAIAGYSVNAHIWVQAVLTDRALLLVKGAVRAKVTRVPLPIEVTRAPSGSRKGVRVRTPLGEKTLWGSKLDAEARLLLDATQPTTGPVRSQPAGSPGTAVATGGAQAEEEAADADREMGWAADEATAAATKRNADTTGPTVGQVMNLRKAPSFSRVRVIDWGSIEEVDDEVSFTVDDVVTLWTDCVEPANTFATVELRGVLGRTPDLQWLPDDAQVEIVELPRFAGQPAELVRDLESTRAPAGSEGAVATPEGFHPLVWDCDPVFSPVQGWDDPATAVEVLLCALNVAPDDGILRPQLLAALRARYSRVLNDRDTYPPADYPWRDTLDPSRSLLEYLEG